MHINTANHVDHSFKAIPTKKEKNPFLSVIHRIWNAIKGVFKKIAAFFQKLFGDDKIKLSNREIEMIHNAKLYNSTTLGAINKATSFTPPKHSTVDALTDPCSFEEKKKARSSFIDAIDLAEPNKIDIAPKKAGKEKSEELFPEIKDPVMKDFHETSLKLIETVLEATFEEKVEPRLSNVKGGLGQFSQGLKFGADIAVTVGNKAAKPLFEKLKDFSPEEKVKPEIDNLLKWLIKGNTSETFPKLFGEALGKEIENEEERNRLVKPLEIWLLQTDLQAPLADMYDNSGISFEENSDKIDKIFEKALLVLLTQKINGFVDGLNEKFENDLPGIMRNMMLNNGKKLGNILVRRAIDLIGNSQYSKMFDELADKVLEHTNAVISAENSKESALKHESNLLKKAKAVQDKPAKTHEEQTTKDDLASHLKRVMSIGPEKWVALQGERKGAEAYAGTDFCHPRFAELLTNPDMPKEEKEKIEKDLYDQFANDIFSILLPKQKVELNGKVSEVDGLVFLWSQMEFPEEFKEITKEVIDISKEILTPTTQKILSEFRGAFWDIAEDHIEKYAVTMVKDHIHKALVQGIRLAFEQILTPQLINEVVATQVLPLIQEEILISLARDSVNRDQKVFAPLFFKLISESSPEGRSEVLEKLSLRFQNNAGNLCKEYKNDFGLLSKDELQAIFLPEIDAIELGIKKYISETGSEPSLKLVAAGLAGYFKEAKHGNNSKYGDLVYKLAFQLGNFDGGVAGVFSDLFKGMISEKVSDVMHQVQTSPHFLVKSASDRIKKKYLDKDNMKDLLFKEQAHLAKDEVDEKLKKEITKTSKAAHDLIFAKISQVNGSMGGNPLAAWAMKTFEAVAVKPLAKNAIGSDATKLDALISKIYKKLLGNKLMTQNLIVRAQEVVQKTLANSSEVIESNGGAKPIKVEKLPSMIPDFLVA